MKVLFQWFDLFDYLNVHNLEYFPIKNLPEQEKNDSSKVEGFEIKVHMEMRS